MQALVVNQIKQFLGSRTWRNAGYPASGTSPHTYDAGDTPFGFFYQVPKDDRITVQTISVLVNHAWRQLPSANPFNAGSWQLLVGGTQKAEWRSNNPASSQTPGLTRFSRDHAFRGGPFHLGFGIPIAASTALVTRFVHPGTETNVPRLCRTWITGRETTGGAIVTQYAESIAATSGNTDVLSYTTTSNGLTLLSYFGDTLGGDAMLGFGGMLQVEINGNVVHCTDYYGIDTFGCAPHAVTIPLYNFPLRGGDWIGVRVGNLSGIGDRISSTLFGMREAFYAPPALPSYDFAS